MRFTGSNVYLALTPASAGTSEVMTFTLTNPANDAGYFRLYFNGEHTDPLAYNETTANLATALNSLSTIRNHNGVKLTATFTEDFADTTTCSFSPNMSLGGVQVEAISESLNDGGTPEFPITTVSTEGVSGFTTGTHDITVYAFIHKDLHSKIHSYRI